MNGIMLVNKPSGITSHDLVGKARRLLHADKVGHCGTLDPLANGLMILTIGKSTKVLPFILHHYKEYIAVVKFGEKTDTLDSTGTVVDSKEVVKFTQQQALDVLNSFLGPSKQIPPMYSAKKVKGQHLYSMARNNEEIEREPIDIDIKEIELLEFNEDSLKFRVLCSTGTYVRTLCDDIATKLNNYGCMTFLQRTKIDKFNLEDAYELADLENGNYKLISAYDLLSDYPYVSYQPVIDVYNGKRIKLDCEEPLVMIVENNEVLAAYYKAEDGYYYCKRGLF